MTPRLKSSKKWTAFPKEYLDQIHTVFRENFSSQLENAELIVEGRIYSEEITLRVGYLEKGRLSQANFEVSMNYSQEQQDAVDRIHNCLDAAASMMMEYFENEGEVDFPYLWKEYPFQGHKLFLQFSTENSSLEAEANRLLGLDENTLLHEEEDTMVHEDEESEDALARAEISEELSPPRDEDDTAEADGDEEDDEDRSPRMFGGGKKKKENLH
ncbi:MAG: hypothetical protein AAGB31_00295 [Bdellovibrio sp.]